jgi:hypothetical protein
MNFNTSSGRIIVFKKCQGSMTKLYPHCNQSSYSAMPPSKLNLYEVTTAKYAYSDSSVP